MGLLSSLVSIDWKKADPIKLKAAVADLCDAIEPAVVTPGNLDKQAFDALKKIAADAIDKLFAGGGLVVNAGPVPTVADANAYLAQFPGTPVACADMVRAHPELVEKLKHFTVAQQEKILANPDWLSLLLTLAPIIVKILLSLLL